MNDKFIKISASSGSGVTSPADEILKLKKDIEDLKKGKQKEDAALDLKNRPSVKGSATDNVINNVVTLSGLQGKSAEALAEELGRRSYLIRRLLSSGLTEDEIADYFNEFLFVNNIDLDKMYTLVQESLDATRVGVDLKDVLDFALAHYSRNRQIELTVYIIENATDLHKTMPNLGVVSILKNSMRGGSPASFNFISMGPENIEKFPIFNELISLALSRPEEDLEQLRIKYEKDRDALINAMRTDDRFKAVFQMLLTNEFQRVQARNVKLVTELFRLSTQSPEFMALRRILTQLQLGQGFIKQFYSDVKQEQTSKEMEREPRNFTSDTKNRVVVAQEVKQLAPNVLSAQQKNILSSQLLQPTIATFNNLLKYLTTNKTQILSKSKDKNKENILNAQIKNIDDFLRTISPLNANLKTEQPVTLKTFNETFWGAVNQLKSVPYAGEKIYKTTVSSSNNFIKTAQPSTSTVNLGSWNLDIANINNLIGKGFVLGTMATTAGGLLSLDPLKAIGGAVGLYLYNNNKQKQEELSKVGLPAPVTVSTETERIEAESNFYTLMNNLGYYQDYIKIKDLLDKTSKVIENNEELLTDLMSENIVTGPGTTTQTPFENPTVIESEYKKFTLLLKEALATAQYYEKFMAELLEAAKQPTDSRIVEIMGPDSQLYIKTTIVPWEKAVRLTAQKFRNLYYKYSSFAKIAKNIQQKTFLLRKLKAVLPEIEKYLGAGVSVADIILMPGGLGEKLRGIINEERNARDLLYDAIVKLRKKVGNIPQTSSTSQNIDIVTKPEQTKTASNNNIPTNVFNNMIIEKHDEVVLENPKQLSQYFVDNFRFSQAITEPTNLVDQYSYETPEVSMGNPDRVKYYEDKIKLTSTNLNLLADYVRKDFGLLPNEKENLLDKIRFEMYVSKIKEFQKITDTNQRTKKLKDVFNYINKDANLSPAQKLQLTSMLGKIPFMPDLSPSVSDLQVTDITEEKKKEEKKGITEGVEGIYEIDPNVQKEADVEAQSLANQLNKELGGRDIKIPFSEDPKILLQSIVQQYLEVAPRVDVLQGIYNRSLTQGDISGISSLASNENKFIKIAEENNYKSENLVEADQRFKDYWDEFYGPWGTVVEEKPEHGDKTFQEEMKLHPERKPKFKKI